MAKLVHNIQKKQHKERSQTSERARYGLLEKKKDYKLRAADYHKKQAAIKALKSKAATYNPDEYYHAMTSNKTDDRGILVSDRGNESLSVQQVKLLKSQDVNYVRTARLNEQSKIAKQKQQLQFEGKGKHTVFVDSFAEQANFRPEEYFQTDKSLLSKRENRLKVDQLEQNNQKSSLVERLDEKDQDFNNLKKLKQYKLLKRRLDREKELKQVESRMEQTRELMKKGSKKKSVDSEGKVQFKWKNQRKR
ncbi:U3 small nucleolar RNA-associated protein 11 [[Candida] railenensis]|uniref:U3 small nucleolar RNA-associated protein 11 n=1 Tax=[Candida] railenensis TaxID=45579 RepID=A0A9P0QNW6_9ASCO|nr:U3 small nucleolar RNA-associated protein 11 [[Candida] railenensis]